MSEVDWICKRSHLRALLALHPDWSEEQLADAAGCSRSTVTRWKKRFAQADRHDLIVLFSRSRAPHHHPPHISDEVKERIEEIRHSPPDNLKRTPGPKAILYYLQKDELLRLQGLRLPRSTRTIWQILDQAGLIERDKPFPRSPLPLQEPLAEVQMDFHDDSTVRLDPTDPNGKRQHVVETCNYVDAGTSRLLSAQVHEDFHAETALQATVTFFREYGLPEVLTFDRDPRLVGSAAQRDFPSAFVQFLHCVGVQPNILPPRHPELNCYVERYHKTYKYECLRVFKPSTLEEVRTVTEQFQHHYNYERPHQGRSCRNRPPALAHPVLPKRPRLPKTVDPDRWLNAMDGRWYPRRVQAGGRIQIGGSYYYIKQALVGHQIMVRLNASTRCFEAFHRDLLVKELPIKDLIGERMPLEAYIELIAEKARSEERQRLLRQRQKPISA